MKSPLLLLLALAPLAPATVTLEFNNAFAGGVSSSLADAAGNVSNGLIWGIIIDTTGAGFSSTYDPLPLTIGAKWTLTTDGAGNGNILITSIDLTQNTDLLFEEDFTTPGGDGGITGIAGIFLEDGVDTSNPFRLVWFDPSGTSAGYIDDPSFILPNDGDLAYYDGPFLGIDPVRPATGIALIPEPSALLIGSLGILTLLRRRR